MSTHRYIDRICVAVAIFTAVLAVLFMNGEAFGIARAAGGASGDGMFTGNDLNADWDASSATRITLSDSGSTFSGNGVYTEDGDVYLAYPGRYVLSGELTDGSVVVAAGKTDQIWILLDGVSLRCEDGAALRVEQAGRVFLTLAEGTDNRISSGPQYREDAVKAGVDGAVYSRDSLTINGRGALEVSGEYQHGIVCNDDLAITGGTITVRGVQDGIHANDSVRIREAALTISAGDDGITVSNDDETAFLYVASGDITIPVCYEGLEAVDITIAGGAIDITPEDDGINANGSGGSSVIRVTGGSITVVNPTGRDADGFDSNGSIYIEGGSIFISVSDSGGNCALDYGSENGGECVISGGTVIACGGGMMAEGFDESSPQGFLMYAASAAAGAAITLEDAAGQELLSAEIPCGFSSIVLSTPEMQVGGVCVLTVNGVREQITVDNTSSSGSAPAGMFRGGMGNEGGRMPGGQDGVPSDRQPPEGMQLPDRSGGGRFPGGMQDLQGGSAPAPAGIDSGSAILLGVSCIVLLAGLAIAFRFRR